MKRRALGRGLSALIPESVSSDSRVSTGASGDLFVCPIEKIRPNKDQPRQFFDGARLEELVASIREHGIVQPLVVRPAKGGTYKLVVGERRWRAAQKAGVHDVPVVIRKMDDLEAFEAALVENIHRADLNPMEEAEAFQRLVAEHGYTQEQLAKRLGKDRSTVANILRLLRLPASAQKALRAGSLSSGHARALLPLEKAALIDKACREIVKRQLSVRQTEQLVRQLLRPPPARSVAHVSPNTRDLEERLRRSLKTQVRLVTASKTKGRIEIGYNTLDELDRLLEVLLK